MNLNRTNLSLIVVCAALALSSGLISLLLARKHFKDFSQRSIQLLILNLITFPPFYSLGSTLCIVFPSIAIYLTLLVECYQSYCLYGFLLLLLFMLGCEEDDFKLVAYLETKTSFQLGFPLNVLCSKDLPRGKAFLLYCRSGVLQLCFLRPAITLTSLVLDEVHLYNEFSTSFRDGYLYLLIAINVSMIYGFGALAAFYIVFKTKLKPFQGKSKFLWFVTVFFLTFWQSVIVTGIVQAGVVSDVGQTSTPLVATRIQNLLVCIEMLMASLASWWIFSYEPYTSGYVNPYDYSDYDEEVDVYERSGRPGAVGANYRYSMLNTGGDVEDIGGGGGNKSNRSNSSRKPVTSSISGGRATLAFTDPTRMSSDAGVSGGAVISGGIVASNSSSGNGVKPTRKIRSFRGPSEMLRRMSGSTTSISSNTPPAAKQVDLLPVVGGPTEYTTARNSSSSSSSGAKKSDRVSKAKTSVDKAKSFVIEGDDDEDGDHVSGADPPAYQNVTDELPEDVMLLLGAKKGSGGVRSSSGTTGTVVARDLNDFGHDGEVAPGSVLLRSIQNKYADTECEPQFPELCK